jgi:ketosteroid isomerase-like protein
MSEDNIALVREGLAAFNRGDFEASLETSSPELEWDTSTAVPDGRTYHGRAEILAYWRSIAERWDDFRIEPDEWIEAGPETVLMLGRLVGRGTESGVPIESTWDQVWRLRDGELVACENYSDRSRARRAAGLD